jgi:peptide/nickel transport system substrate-binding protein
MKKLLLPLLVALVMVAIMAACAPAPAPTPAPKPAPAKDAPVRGGTLVIMHAREATGFGFPVNVSGATREYIDALFDRLIFINDKGEYEASLATSWQTSTDGKTITLKIRDGVKFHDGTAFDAAAAKWNLDNLRPPNPVKMDGVSSIEAVDASTLRINLTAPNNLILFQLASDYACYMYSPTAYQKNGKDWAANNAVGTGAFKQESYNRATGLKLVKNPDYWEKGLPYLDAIDNRTVTDDMTQITAFKAGQANIMWNAQPEAAYQLKDAGKVVLASGANWTIAFDTKNNKTLADPKIRAAIEYAINKEAITEGPGYGLFPKKYQLFNEGSPGYNKSLTPRKYDPAKAKQLLAEAGYPDGFSFKLHVLSTTWREGIVAAQADLAKVGIKMDINFMPAAQYNVIRNDGKIEAGSASMMTLNLFANPLYVLDFYFRSDSGQYQFMQRPAGSDALIAKAKETQDAAAVNKMCQDLVKMLYDDVTFVPMWDTARIAILDKTVQDHGYFIAGDAANIRVGRSTWLKK